MAHKSRRGNRGFQLLRSRRLKFHRLDDIGDRDFPAVLECGLRPEDICFAQLGERKSFHVLDGDLELLSIQSRGEPPELPTNSSCGSLKIVSPSVIWITTELVGLLASFQPSRISMCQSPEYSDV
jgi:hypothetical protein